MEEKQFLKMDSHCEAELRDKLVKKLQHRPLCILVVMTLNNLNAILDADYLTDMLESFRQLIVNFQKDTKRVTTISFMLYIKPCQGGRRMGRS